MTIDRSPQPVLAAVWFGWYGFVLAALAQPDRPLFGLLVLVAFLPIEAVGVFWDSGSRDTLSEIATWVIRHLSKDRRVARGWNAMLLMVVLTIAWLLGRTVWYYSGYWLLAVLMGGLTTTWLHDHWLNPDIGG